MSTRCHVSTRKGLFTLERRSRGWTISRVNFLGDNCTIALHDPRTGHLFVALNHGHFGVKLHRSTDGGATWQEIATPVYPEKPADTPASTAPQGRPPVDWSLKLVWSLAPGGVDQPGLIWCGTLPGGLFRSNDNGDSWTLNHQLWDDPRREEWVGGGADHPGIHSIAVDPRDSQHVLIGISCGGVWRTRDAGASWQIGGPGLRAEFMPPERQFDPNIQDPHLLVQCRAQPDLLWVQHHNGIFRSINAAHSWTEITGVDPSTFGFGVAVHPHNGDTAWFVPAVKDELRYPAHGRVVVTRTRDGGGTFETLTRGLPQEHAYDLVYRHALDVDEHGRSLMFGSTTGSLWASDDEGDSWETVSAHLPPIYAVTFEKSV
jgi:hypothetical protein